jgi:non-specific serine/threonine protein kinase
MPAIRPAPRTNLRAPGELIGRDEEGATVWRLVLEAPGRLVTLTGPGGVGKTELALHVARPHTEAFTGGIWFVDVASVRSAEQLPSAMAGVLLLGPSNGRGVLDAVLNYLHASDLLLVLDNCEHLVDACASLAEQILVACPNVRLLATSRERLRIARETVWHVRPLLSPSPEARLSAAELHNYPAIRLFVEHATAAQPELVLNEAAIRSVIGICARLDGMPLALEFAAARVTALSLTEILEHLDHSMQLLAAGSRTAPGRQQTMRATLDWSYALLNEAERAVLRRLAVFCGDWVLQAARAVCAGDSVRADDVLDILASLVDKSLVVVVNRQNGQSRYKLLEPTRQYGLERLEESREAADVRERYALHMVAFAAPLGRDAGVGGQGRWVAVESLLRDYANLRAALSWAVETRNGSIGLQFAAALEHIWKFFTPLEEGRAWSTAILELPGVNVPTRERALALLTAASLALARGDQVEASRFYAEAVPLARQLDDPWLLFVALIDSSNEARYRGDSATADRRWEEALAITRATGDGAGEAVLLVSLASRERRSGDLSAARAHYEEAVALERQARDPLGTCMALDGLATMALDEGDTQTARALTLQYMRLNPPLVYRKSGLLKLVQIALAEGAVDDAREHLMEALTLAKAYGNRVHNAEILDAVAEVIEAYRNNPRLALSLAAMVEAVWAPAGWARQSLDMPTRTRWLARLERSIPADALTAWRMEARELSLDEAMGLAENELRLMGDTPAPVDDAEPLTPRQRQVAVLVARGLTNRQIARELVITERAAANHIEHIMNRLHVNRRTEIGVWASEQGLLAKQPNQPAKRTALKLVPRTTSGSSR